MLIIPAIVCNGQNDSRFATRYLKTLPAVHSSKNTIPQKYRMTAVYMNRDLYGNFTSKTKVTGDYTRGLPGDSAMWNNVRIAGSTTQDGEFPQGSAQPYIENFRYCLSSDMLQGKSFKNFPANIETVFARNLIWDMMAIEMFAWRYRDSLKLNIPYNIPDIKGSFNMGGIGDYNHKNIQVSWKGITRINNELCAIVDYAAIDNKIEMKMDQISTKGTEQYWGTVLVSLKTNSIEHAVMYSGTIQEISVNGMKDKFLAKTIRELNVERIQ